MSDSTPDLIKACEAMLFSFDAECAKEAGYRGALRRFCEAKRLARLALLKAKVYPVTDEITPEDLIIEDQASKLREKVEESKQPAKPKKTTAEMMGLNPRGYIPDWAKKDAEGGES